MNLFSASQLVWPTGSTPTAGFTTVNEAQPWAEAVAIKDGNFLAVGSTAEMQALTGDTTEVVDLGGQFVMPGLVDTHTHPFDSAFQILDQLVLDNPQTLQDIQQQVVAYAEANPDKEWILGLSWPKGMFPGENPHRSDVGRSGRRHSNLPDGPGWDTQIGAIRRHLN